MKKRLVVGISGASGAPLAVDLLREMQRHQEWETHLVVTDGAKRTIHEETDLSLADVEALAHVVYDVSDIGAAIASGTFRAEGMVIVPCSMKTLAGVATDYADNLLLRAADVMLKQRRKLVMCVRETPIHALHLKNMQTVVELGAVVLRKGHETVITDGYKTYVNRTGNAGMATGGSGDVLAGMLVSMLGQGVPALEAAACAAWLHGTAGDYCAAERGQYGLSPTDLIGMLPYLLP